MKIMLVGKSAFSVDVATQYARAKAFLEDFGFEVRGKEFVPNYDKLDYLLHELALLETYDAVYMLAGWRDDRKAIILFLAARMLDKQVFMQEDNERDEEDEEDDDD